MSNSCLRAFDDGSRIGMANQQAALHGLDDVNLTRSALVYHVQNALGSVPYGDSDCYNQLVGVMHHTRRLAPDEVALLETCLKALSGAVTCIDFVHLSSFFFSHDICGEHVKVGK